jgi:hypothetical protein
MDQYIFARDKWKPESVKILLVAESPPVSGGYFYYEEATGKGGLFVETMQALKLIPEKQGLPRGFSKKALLEMFKSYGFFMIDVSYFPLDGMKPLERRLAIKNELPRFVEELKRLDPENIIIVKKSIYRAVRSAIENAGFGNRILNQKALPFPSYQWKKIYRQGLWNLVTTRKNSSLRTT